MRPQLDRPSSGLSQQLPAGCPSPEHPLRTRTPQGPQGGPCFQPAAVPCERRLQAGPRDAGGPCPREFWRETSSPSALGPSTRLAVSTEGLQDKEGVPIPGGWGPSTSPAFAPGPSSGLESPGGCAPTGSTERASSSSSAGPAGSETAFHLPASRVPSEPFAGVKFRKTHGSYT